jgi:hypothetical protein
MTSAISTYEQELCIAADWSELGRLRNFATAVAAHCGYDRRARFRAMTAVYEAVASQLAAGGRSRRSISVRALWSGGCLTFWIRSPFQLEPGLGTQLMKMCAREVHVLPGAGGTTVRLSV